MKKYIPSVIFFMIGFSCFLLFSYFGSYVDDNGMLIEQFAFIPIGYFFLFLGILTTSYVQIRAYLKSRKKL